MPQIFTNILLRMTCVQQTSALDELCCIIVLKFYVSEAVQSLFLQASAETRIAGFELRTHRGMLSPLILDYYEARSQHSFTYTSVSLIGM